MTPPGLTPQDYLDAEEAADKVLDAASSPTRPREFPLFLAEHPAFRAAVDSAFAAGWRKADEDAQFWFNVCVNTATRSSLPCTRCEHPVQAHWPADERGKPGCHRSDCLCSWTPQEVLIEADKARAEHGRAMDGYFSPRCSAGMPGCDDLACVCRCHDGGVPDA